VGRGANAKGGRGGTVYRVTNLSDSGAGSLRACIDASGPRTCVFAVAGQIKVQSKMRITNPFITIAGQTAPGGGIELAWANAAAENDDVLAIENPAHDVVIRYLRIRPGLTQHYGSAIGNNTAIYNVVLDHLSIAWSTWDNVSFYASSPSKNITLQWSILAEPFTVINGGCTINLGAPTSAVASATTDVDLHHNFIATADHRNPIHRVKSGRIVNNLIYNWTYYATRVTGFKDVIGNYYKPGPTTGGSRPGPEIIGWYHNDGNNWYDASTPPSFFLSGNAGPGNSYNPATDNWSTLTGWAPSGDAGTVTSPMSTSYRRTTPLADVGAPITRHVATDLASASGPFLPIVGASRRLDCSGNWVLNRDAVDAGFVTQFLAASGRNAHAITTVGTYPLLAAGAACADADGDGMPDAYETAHGLNPSDRSDGAALAPNGYTNLENYLDGQ
jgi:hypothetical protein